MRMSGQRHASSTIYPEDTHSTHWTGGWVDPRADLGTEARENSLFVSAGDRTWIARLSSPYMLNIFICLFILSADNNTLELDTTVSFKIIS
jgi:hypothetical protein